MRKAAMTPQEKEAARVKRATERRAQDAEEREERERELAWIRDRGVHVGQAMAVLEGRAEDARRQERTRAALLDHASGFYEEMDKLAKGKAMLEVTDIMVERANAIIADAKSLVTGDTHLDRVKEFVPAGNNPVYPDVVVQLRAVIDSSRRFETILDDCAQQLDARIVEALTLAAALNATEDHNYELVPGRVKAFLSDPDALAMAWFIRDPDGHLTFDLDRLEELDVEAYFAVSEQHNA